MGPGSRGSSTNAVQDLLGDVDIIVPVTRPSRCMDFVVLGVGVVVCPSIYWYMLLIPINDAATKSTIIDTEVFLGKERKNSMVKEDLIYMRKNWRNYFNNYNTLGYQGKPMLSRNRESINLSL